MEKQFAHALNGEWWGLNFNVESYDKFFPNIQLFEILQRK